MKREWGGILKRGGVAPDGVAGAHADPLGKGAVLLLLLAELLLNLEGLLGRLLMGGTGGWGGRRSAWVLCGGALQTLKKPRMDGRDGDDRRAVRPSRRGDGDDHADTTRRDAIARVTMLAARRRAPARQVSSSHPNPKHTDARARNPG